MMAHKAFTYRRPEPKSLSEVEPMGDGVRVARARRAVA